MALSGKLIGYVEISKKGDVFHDLLRHNPHELAEICPDKVHGYDLLDGERGPLDLLSVGTTLLGKRASVKKVIESVNEENHTIVFKITGGELVEELYKSLTITFHVEQKGDGQMATWTIEFEKPDTSVPYPTSEMDFLCNMIKAMDTHDNTK